MVRFRKFFILLVFAALLRPLSAQTDVRGTWTAELRSGKVFTYSVARIGGNVTPVHFQRLDGTGNASAYSQAIASWVGAEIDPLTSSPPWVRAL